MHSIRSRAALVAAALALAFAASTANGGHISGTCGRDASRDDGYSCTFYVRGIPLIAISGDGTSNGTASIHVWVTEEPAEGVDSPAIADCSASAPKKAHCENVFPLPLGSTVDSGHQITVLTCHMTGTGVPVSGVTFSPPYYTCASGYGY